MMHCPNCNLDFSDSHKFCDSCGGVLIDKVVVAQTGQRCPDCRAEVEPYWRICNKCGYDLRLALTPVKGYPALICRHCGTDCTEEMKFCDGCGKPLRESEANQTAMPSAVYKYVVQIPSTEAATQLTKSQEPGTVSIIQESPPARKRKSLVVGALALFAFLASGGTVYWLMGESVERKLEEAIARGNLVKPPGESAYDFYQQLKREGVSANKLVRFNEKLMPLLTTDPQQMLIGIADPAYEDPTPAEWQEAHKLMAWASEMKPSDSSLAARATYCLGRAAYLNGRKDEALELWRRANNEDRSWAIPANGIGLTYNERKDYATARRFFYEAIRREPGWALPYNNLGTSFFYERDYDQAQSYYLQAVERSPQWPRPHAWLGDIAMIRKDYSRAVREYEKVLDLSQLRVSNLDLDKIKQKLEQARQLSSRQMPEAVDNEKDQ